MGYTVKYNRSTNHIDGVAVRATGAGEDSGGVVSYYAQNACGSITRYQLADGASFGSLGDALAAARIAGGRKLCRTCEKAAEAQIAAEAEPAAGAGGAKAGGYSISLSPLTVDYLSGTSCMQGDEEPEVRAELLALRTRADGSEAGKVSFATLQWLVEYLDTWIDVAYAGDSPGERRAAEAAYKKINALYEKAQKEGTDMAESKTDGAPLKLKDVRGDIRVGSVTGSNGTIHAIKGMSEDGRNLPYCPMRSKNPLRSWGPAIEQNGELDLCAKCSKLVPTGPVTVTEKTMEIPGLGRTKTQTIITPVEDGELDAADASAVRRLAESAGLVSGTTTEEKVEPMAATAKKTATKKTATKKTAAKKTASSDGPKVMTEDQQKAAADEIRADIERLSSLTAEGKDEAVKELADEIKNKTLAITGTGAAAIKASLRSEGGKALKEAQAARKAAASKELATKKESELEEVLADPTIKALIAQGSEKVKEVARRKFEGGYEIAKIIFDLRRRIDFDGRPDLNAQGQPARTATEKVFDDLLESLPEGEEWADQVRLEMASIRISYRNSIKDVRAEYLKGLDHSPEEAALFQEALDAHKDLKPSEAVAKHYGWELRTRAEIQKDYREKKKAVDAKKKELEAKVEAKELTPEQASEQLDAFEREQSGGSSEKRDDSPKGKALEEIERLKKAGVRAAKRATKLEAENDRDDVLEALAAAMAEIRAASKEAKEAKEAKK